MTRRQQSTKGRLGEFEQLILFAVFQLQDEACGVEIRETLEARAGQIGSLGAIYTTLGRLEERGLVRSRVEEPQPGRTGRPRKLYELMPSGARALMVAYRTMQAMAGDLIPELSELAER